MNITVSAEKTQDGKLEAQVSVSAEDVKAQVAKTYKDLAAKYNFQGFRRGRAPRPVIDSMLGKEAVLAQATNDLVDAAQPQIKNELDLVLMGEPTFDEKNELIADGKEYKFTISYMLVPEAELDSYEAPEINMPPSEVTDAEIEWQLKQLLRYRSHYENTTSKRKVSKDDVISVKIENVEGAEHLEAEDRTVNMSVPSLPDDLQEALIGMKPGETKEVEWKISHEHEGETHEHNFKVNVKVLAHKEEVVPELDDAYAKENFGYDTVEEVKDEMKKQIEEDKKVSLPNLKEDRVVEAMGKRLQLDEVPEFYLESVYNEIAQEFLGSLQQQNMTLDTFLAYRGISIEDFIADLRAQADERARQALALDALVRKLELEATNDEVMQEFKDVYDSEDEAKKRFAEFEAAGNLPNVRESIRRTKALKWLVENAQVTVKDEVAERLAEEDAASKKSKTSKKAKASKADEAEATEE